MTKTSNERVHDNVCAATCRMIMTSKNSLPLGQVIKEYKYMGVWLRIKIFWAYMFMNALIGNMVSYVLVGITICFTMFASEGRLWRE